MKENKMRCISCGKELDEEGVVFPCPKCGKPIARCGHCRKRTIKYKCECSFEGP